MVFFLLLQFPVGCIHRKLKTMVSAHGKIAATDSVYAASILEYLTTEVLTISQQRSETEEDKS